ncbi:MAG: hypothetical protein FWC96_00585 [Oscillospiraceae bacterium]|nr:hypothetical protein [Oscillospiraceae bacterium]
MKKLLILAFAITIMSTLFACSAQDTEYDDTNITRDDTTTKADSAATTNEDATEPRIVRAPAGSAWVDYLTFEQVLLHVSTDIVIANYVGSRPFGETVTEFEFTVLDRILGYAADTIFVYASNVNESVMGDTEGLRYNPSTLTFNSGTDYLLVLRKLGGAYMKTHPDGYVFSRNLIINLDNLDLSTMYNESLSLHTTEINFNSRSLDREQLLAFIAEKTANNTPGRGHIRSKNIVDIVTGSPYILIVEINEFIARAATDFMHNATCFVTVVEVLEGDIDVGPETMVFFADTVQPGERHIVAAERLDGGSFLVFTSRNSLFRLDQRDEILAILSD